MRGQCKGLGAKGAKCAKCAKTEFRAPGNSCCFHFVGVCSACLFVHCLSGVSLFCIMRTSLIFSCVIASLFLDSFVRALLGAECRRMTKQQHNRAEMTKNDKAKAHDNYITSEENDMSVLRRRSTMHCIS